MSDAKNVSNNILLTASLIANIILLTMFVAMGQRMFFLATNTRIYQKTLGFDLGSALADIDTRNGIYRFLDIDSDIVQPDPELRAKSEKLGIAIFYLDGAWASFEWYPHALHEFLSSYNASVVELKKSSQ